MAQLHARGELPGDTDFVSVSLIGSEFVGRVAGLTAAGEKEAILPVITRRAWITATANWLLDPEDPFPEGFLF